MRDVVRVVLQVAVQEHQHVAAAVVDPRLDGRRLPEVAAKADHPDPRVPRRKLPELVGAPVAAAVVDVQDLKGGAEGFQHAGQLAVQRLDAVDLVVDENYHGYVRRIGRSLARHESRLSL